MNKRIIILDSCLKELKKLPLNLQKDFQVIAVELNKGIKLSLPLSRPMPSIGKGVHELRLNDGSGHYRIIYYLQAKANDIYFLHAFKKKTQTTFKKNLDLAKRRLKGTQ